MKKILVVEDDPTVQNVLRCLFEAEHYTVEVASDGKSALGALRAELPSAVILDLRLPRISGSEVCGKIKKNAPSPPVIVLSATAEVTDKVQLLELGADDYVPEPFSPREFLARVQAAIRRTTHTQALDVFSFGDISVDFGKMETYKGAQPVAMTAHQFKLLRFFVENAGRVIPRSELLHEVWGYRDYPVTRIVDNQIWKLRLKLEPKPRDPVYLLTVHGAGYKFLT